MRAELLAIQAAFDKLNALTGNADKPVVVNSSGNGLTVLPPGNNTILGTTSWTPTLTCATPGNLAVSYATRNGTYRRFGPVAFIEFDIGTSSFTHTTASGSIQITGLPGGVLAIVTLGLLTFGGITKASYTQFNLEWNGANFNIVASGSAVARAIAAIGDMPTGGVVNLHGIIMGINAW